MNSSGRRLFFILDGQLKCIADEKMDHREWISSLGLPLDNFENIVRGYVIDGKIVFFKGSTFNYDDEVYKDAIMYGPMIRDICGNSSLPICCGILIEAYGSKWEPIVVVSEDDINKGIAPKPEVKEKKEYVSKETGPVIEIKNDYENPEFIKKAFIVTTFVFAITIILQMYFYSFGNFKLGSLVDMLLSLGQVGCFGYAMYMYKNNNGMAKYVSIAGAVLLMLSFNLLAIVVGILYLLFCIDQNYFTKIINMINKKKN